VHRLGPKKRTRVANFEAKASSKKPFTKHFRRYGSVLKRCLLSWTLIAAFALPAQLCQGQSAVLNLPRSSQHAVLNQRIGITDITINYHRPLVNGRQVWGKLVPYGDVWRAGANENTTITFSDPVTIEGQALAAGTYGLHMIPNESDWTIIFSKNSTSWGSFTYDKSEDALRVSVKPQPTDMHEALTYDFDDVKPAAAVVTMRWEKLAVPFKVDVKTDDIVVDNLHKQLRGFAQYTWDGWDDAANYLLAEKVHLDEALTYTDKSIQNEERYENLMTKSRVLAALGRNNEAKAQTDKALAHANAVQLHTYARGLQNEGKAEDAYKVFQENAKRNPESWIVHVGMARMYSGKGDFSNASKELATALTTAPDAQKQPLQALGKRLDAKQDINK
jgi:tetratricopeptide (TPR) repeat protein